MRARMRMDKVQAEATTCLLSKASTCSRPRLKAACLNRAYRSHYQLEVRRENFMDTLTVNVELIDASLLETYKELENLRAEIKHKLRTVLGIDAKINLVSPKTIERFQGKAKRVIDLRDKS